MDGKKRMVLPATASKVKSTNQNSFEESTIHHFFIFDLACCVVVWWEWKVDDEYRMTTINTN